MPLQAERVSADQAGDRTQPACSARCPVCSGPLVELRSTLRCARCYFTFCEGCTGDASDGCADAGD